MATNRTPDTNGPDAHDTEEANGDAQVLTDLSAFAVLLELWTAQSFQEAMIASVDGVSDVRSSGVLFVLGMSGPLSPAELADALSTGRSNMSKIVGRLRGEGLITREDDANDRRGAKIALTGRGQEVAQALAHRSQTMLQELVEGWPAERIARFGADLTEFVDRAQRYSARLRLDT